ncbi:MAG TPA: DNA alkylation response protein, partial [Xanthobacteraceae bacterium]|nr:DNA alkylation response protein [Xanthobacteraceae bacterium]
RAVLGALANEAADLPGARDTARAVETALAAPDAEANARAAVGRLAQLAAAAAVRQSAPPEVAELFARTRLEARHGAMFGTSDVRAEEASRLLERALPPA